MPIRAQRLYAKLRMSLCQQMHISPFPQLHKPFFSPLGARQHCIVRKNIHISQNSFFTISAACLLLIFNCETGKIQFIINLVI
jgi:hypothetical protein